MGFEIDPDKPISELLAKVKEGALEGASSQSRTSAYAIAPFSALLVRLASDADKQAKKLVWLTRALIGLTIGLLVVTVALVWEGFK